MKGTSTDWYQAATVGLVGLGLALLGIACSDGGDLRMVDPLGTDLEGVDSAAGRVALLEKVDQNVPVLFVDRLKNGGYSYHLQEQLYEEREILSLMRSIVRNDPTITVVIVPSPALTTDEIGLAEAKLREVGVKKVRVAGGH